MGPHEQQGGTLLSTASSTRTGGGETSLNQKVALAFGAIYVLVGILGFFVSEQFISQEDNKLLGIFMVNHLHNIVHLLIGVALIGASRAGDRAARSTNMTIGAVYLLLGILGWFINNTALDIVALNPADHVLHLLSGAVLVGVSRVKDTVGHNTRTV